MKMNELCSWKLRLRELQSIKSNFINSLLPTLNVSFSFVCECLCTSISSSILYLVDTLSFILCSMNRIFRVLLNEYYALVCLLCVSFSSLSLYSIEPLASPSSTHSLIQIDYIRSNCPHVRIARISAPHSLIILDYVFHSLENATNISSYSIACIMPLRLEYRVKLQFLDIEIDRKTALVICAARKLYGNRYKHEQQQQQRRLRWQHTNTIYSNNWNISV